MKHFVLLLFLFSNLFSSIADSNAFRYDLLSDRWKIDSYIKSTDDVNKHFLEIQKINESTVPLVKPLRTIDNVYIHPSKSTTILLPPGSKIESAFSTLGYVDLHIQSGLNMIDLTAKDQFVSDSAIIVFNLNGKNFIMKLLLSKYEQLSNHRNQFYSIISYYQPKKQSDIDVLMAYKKEYGNYPKKKYSFINLDGITYKITRDNKYGNIKIENLKYRIETRIVNE